MHCSLLIHRVVDSLLPVEMLAVLIAWWRGGVAEDDRGAERARNNTAQTRCTESIAKARQDRVQDAVRAFLEAGCLLMVVLQLHLRARVAGLSGTLFARVIS